MTPLTNRARAAGAHGVTMFSKKPVLLAAAGALLFAALTACGGTASEEEHATYPATRPLRTNSEIVREYVAQVRAIQHIDLRAMEAGYLQDVFVDEGQAVTKGQRMFQIMPTIYQAEQQRAAAEVELARLEYENTRALQEKNVVSPNELALAKARLDKAKAELALYQAHLSLTDIRAPFDGIMNRLEVRKGSLLEEGELLTTLSDNHQMWVYFNLTESEYLAYKARNDATPMQVKLRMANGELFPHPGVVETIEADFHNETGNIAFRATFPNPDGLLRHGETGNILVSQPLPNVLLVPQKATFDILDHRYVFVVDGEGVVHQREISVAQEMPHVYVVREGLADDDQVLLDGLRKVRDGDHVAIDLEASDQVFAALEHIHAE